MTEIPAPPGESKRFKFETAFTVPGTVPLLVRIPSFFVPAGADERLHRHLGGRRMIPTRGEIHE